MRGIVGLAVAIGMTAPAAFAQTTAPAQTPPAASPPAMRPAAMTNPPEGQRGHLSLVPPAQDMLDQAILVLVPGRTASITLGDQNAMTLASEGVDEVTNLNMPGPVDGYDTRPVSGVARPVEPGRLTFTLSKDPRGGATLMYANGLPRSVVLAAAISMVVNGQRRTSLTTICTAAPGQRDFESWPQNIDLVQVIQVLDAPPGSCFDPMASAFYRDGDMPPSARPQAAPTPPATAVSPSQPGS